MASLFDTLQANAFRAGIKARTRASRKWFSTNVKNLQVSRSALLRDTALKTTNVPVRGSMYMYFYDPKFKATLPYYDRFPLTVLVDGAPGGFYGLNLHYLPYGTRAKFLDDLMAFGPPNATESSRLTGLRYNLISGVRKFKEFRPCFKHYLGSNVKSQLSRVPMTDWEIAIFLPVEQFKKSGKQAIWQDSLRQANSPGFSAKNTKAYYTRNMKKK